MFAHDIAGWLGVPAGVVIAATIILRRRGMALRARRLQARQARQSALGERADSAAADRD
jgi:hypothetical protein